MTAKGKIPHSNSVEGFTLLETLFVILLTSIVVSLIFVYFNTFQRYIVQLNKASVYEIQVLRFESLMQFDLDRSSKVLYAEADLPEIICKGPAITYIVGETFMVRLQNDVADTLKANKLELIPLFVDGSDSLMKAFTIEFEDFNLRNRSYSFYIRYAEKTIFEEFNASKRD